MAPRRLGIFRILCTPDGLPHCQVHLPASDSGVLSVLEVGLADLPVSAARIHLFPTLQPSASSGSVANPVAPVFGVNNNDGRSRPAQRGIGDTAC